MSLQIGPFVFMSDPGVFLIVNSFLKVVLIVPELSMSFSFPPFGAKALVVLVSSMDQWRDKYI